MNSDFQLLIHWVHEWENVNRDLVSAVLTFHECVPYPTDPSAAPPLASTSGGKMRRNSGDEERDTNVFPLVHDAHNNNNHRSTPQSVIPHQLTPKVDASLLYAQMYKMLSTWGKVERWSNTHIVTHLLESSLEAWITAEVWLTGGVLRLPQSLQSILTPPFLVWESMRTEGVWSHALEMNRDAWLLPFGVSAGDTLKRTQTNPPSVTVMQQMNNESEDDSPPSAPSTTVADNLNNNNASTGYDLSRATSSEFTEVLSLSAKASETSSSPDERRKEFPVGRYSDLDTLLLRFSQLDAFGRHYRCVERLHHFIFLRVAHDNPTSPLVRLLPHITKTVLEASAPVVLEIMIRCTEYLLKFDMPISSPDDVLDARERSDFQRIRAESKELFRRLNELVRLLDDCAAAGILKRYCSATFAMCRFVGAAVVRQLAAVAPPRHEEETRFSPLRRVAGNSAEPRIAQSDDEGTSLGQVNAAVNCAQAQMRLLTEKLSDIFVGHYGSSGEKKRKQTHGTRCDDLSGEAAASRNATGSRRIQTALDSFLVGFGSGGYLNQFLKNWLLDMWFDACRSCDTSSSENSGGGPGASAAAATAGRASMSPHSLSRGVDSHSNVLGEFLRLMLRKDALLDEVEKDLSQAVHQYLEEYLTHHQPDHQRSSAAHHKPLEAAHAARSHENSQLSALPQPVFQHIVYLVRMTSVFAEQPPSLCDTVMCKRIEHAVRRGVQRFFVDREPSVVLTLASALHTQVQEDLHSAGVATLLVVDAIVDLVSMLSSKDLFVDCYCGLLAPRLMMMQRPAELDVDSETISRMAVHLGNGVVATPLALIRDIRSNLTETWYQSIPHRVVGGGSSEPSPITSVRVLCSAWWERHTFVRVTLAKLTEISNKNPGKWFPVSVIESLQSAEEAYRAAHSPVREVSPAQRRGRTQGGGSRGYRNSAVGTSADRRTPNFNLFEEGSTGGGGGGGGTQSRSSGFQVPSSDQDGSESRSYGAPSYDRARIMESYRSIFSDNSGGMGGSSLYATYGQMEYDESLHARTPSDNSTIGSRRGSATWGMGHGEEDDRRSTGTNDHEAGPTATAPPAAQPRSGGSTGDRKLTWLLCCGTVTVRCTPKRGSRWVSLTAPPIGLLILKVLESRDSTATSEPCTFDWIVNELPCDAPRPMVATVLRSLLRHHIVLRAKYAPLETFVYSLADNYDRVPKKVVLDISAVTHHWVPLTVGGSEGAHGEMGSHSALGHATTGDGNGAEDSNSNIDPAGAVSASLDSDRVKRLEACVVRIMKMHRRLDHAALLSACTDELRRFFSVPVPLFKECIAQLIEREFLERDGYSCYVYLS